MPKLDVTVAKTGATTEASKKVQLALKKTLAKQLAAEAKTLGKAPGTAAIHGMTGVSTKQGAKDIK